MLRSFVICLAMSALTCCIAHADEIRPRVFRTPDIRFENLPGYSYPPNYAEILEYRIHYIDAGPKDAPPVLLMHGEPSWSYLYRKMIPILVDAGYRVVAPDLLGFGRSDKPADRAAYSYQLQVDIITALVEQLELQNITLFCQDWGGLVGLRVAAENEDRFARVIAANTGLPESPGEDGTIIGAQFTEPDPNAVLSMQDGFMAWLRYSQVTPTFDSGQIIQAATVTTLPADVVAAYNAPFPDDRYLAGARVMPTLVMSQTATNRRAWQVFERWEKPFLTLFSDGDPITKGGYRAFQSRIPGAKDQPHEIIKGGGHFLQEDKGPEIARRIVNFIRATE